MSFNTKVLGEYCYSINYGGKNYYLSEKIFTQYLSAKNSSKNYAFLRKSANTLSERVNSNFTLWARQYYYQYSVVGYNILGSNTEFQFSLLSLIDNVQAKGDCEICFESTVAHSSTSNYDLETKMLTFPNPTTSGISVRPFVNAKILKPSVEQFYILSSKNTISFESTRQRNKY